MPFCCLPISWTAASIPPHNTVIMHPPSAHSSAQNLVSVTGLKKKVSCSNCLSQALSLASGANSLQGMPSIFLIKQWLCAQLIQGCENATKRDLNIKHWTICARLPVWLVLYHPSNTCFVSPKTVHSTGIYFCIITFISLSVCVALSSTLCQNNTASIKIAHTYETQPRLCLMESSLIYSIYFTCLC